MTEHKPRLLFKNPEFQEGVNATVRLGLKWYGQAPEESVVEVWETNGGYLFDAFIVKCERMKICDIPDDILQHEHDPRCRNARGLLEVLRATYNRMVSPRETVTVLLFEQCEPDPGEWDAEIEPPRVH